MYKVSLGAGKTFYLVIQFFALYRAIQLYVYDFRTAIGPSMIPTIREGKYIISW